MATLKKRVSFFETEEGLEILASLRGMAAGSTFNTNSSYSSNQDLHPDNLITFVEKHVNYINAHPGLDAATYVKNLRLMTRIR
jgi:hypothetical protein